VRLVGYTDLDWVGVLHIGRVLPGAVLGWVRQVCRGSGGNNSQFH
jgi:hypothetical protein